MLSMLGGWAPIEHEHVLQVTAKKRTPWVVVVHCATVPSHSQLGPLHDAPVLQTQSPSTSGPTLFVGQVSGAHWVRFTPPVASMNVSVGHAWQVVGDVPFVKLFLSQGVHGIIEVADTVPGAHTDRTLRSK